MKIIASVILVMLALKGFAQHNLYTSNNGIYMDENQIRLSFDNVRKTLPPSYDLTAIIYHKIMKKDTVINYVTVSASQSSSLNRVIPSDLKFEYKQDSTFLLLNRKLPFFRLKDLDGKEITSNDLLGKPALINFWATYCGPCVAEMPQLSKLKEKYKDQMNFISITENNVVKDKLRDFLMDKNFNFKVLDDGESYKRELRIAALPRNLFIDKNGILRYIQFNYPLNAESKPVAVDDKNNYFIKIIEELTSHDQQNIH